METKTYIRRDSATAVLRKMGIKARDYNHFIEKEDGCVICLVGKAKAHLTSKVVKTSRTKTKKSKPKKEKKVTISSYIRDLILDGKSNAQILSKLETKYGAEWLEDKRHYPAWYRAELRRKGQLPPAFDTPRQDPSAVHKLED